jgi:hypothetical protein
MNALVMRREERRHCVVHADSIVQRGHFQSKQHLVNILLCGMTLLPRYSSMHVFQY